MITDIKIARELLQKADVFYDCLDDDDPPELAQTLNMNDVWGWATASGEYVPDEKLPEVATLFFNYGWPGLLYWVSEQNNSMRSSFHDNNRFIDFVCHEENLKKEIPSSTKRAYKKITYTLGD